MEIRPHRIIKRKKTKKIKVGNLYIGGDSPISVQSMTKSCALACVSALSSDNFSVISLITALGFRWLKMRLAELTLYSPTSSSV